MGILLVVGLFSRILVPAFFLFHRFITAPKEKRWQFGLLWLLVFTTAEGIAIAASVQCCRIIEFVGNFPGPSD